MGTKHSKSAESERGGKGEHTHSSGSSWRNSSTKHHNDGMSDPDNSPTDEVNEVIVAATSKQVECGMTTVPALPPFDASSKWNRPVNPGCLMEQSMNIEVWERILHNSVLGTRFFLKASIVCMATGGIAAFHPDDYQATVEQVKQLHVGLRNPGTLAVSGIQLANDHYKYTSGQEGMWVTGKCKDASETCVLIRGGKRCALIGVYNKMRHNEVKGLFDDLVEYFSQSHQGF